MELILDGKTVEVLEVYSFMLQENVRNLELVFLEEEGEIFKTSVQKKYNLIQLGEEKYEDMYFYCYASKDNELSVFSFVFIILLYNNKYEVLNPSPNQKNEEVAIYKYIEAPTFSADSGFYDNKFYLSLSTNSEANIYYTVDSSDPTVNSTLYEDEILVKED